MDIESSFIKMLMELGGELTPMRSNYNMLDTIEVSQPKAEETQPPNDPLTLHLIIKQASPDSSPMKSLPHKPTTRKTKKITVEVKEDDHIVPKKKVKARGKKKKVVNF
ncbi:uncharacterized protein MELLADRAFT_65652 [Melampsora larici-populina 98AG31]|uniref:Uncharacterized protein n=1 Tax=Melampsora larici-populina (strain 98AG31 / pathotype 3-4-7) TaxID=747676 RepID=F4RW82_MELLP|nr:uncharacterized protein MELLADRAFT_65652 [Melampsora larici-populina 98AG31]EGG03366.1 hypothetical protein MELLADRAFT_65652 [Melampsora larici-populina 98AG31]